MGEQPANYQEILFSVEEVSQRIDELAAEVIARYRGTKTIFVSLLNGAQPFTAKLMFAIQRLDEESARQTLELFDKIGIMDEEFGDSWGRAAAEAGAPRPAGTAQEGGAS